MKDLTNALIMQWSINPSIICITIKFWIFFLKERILDLTYMTAGQYKPDKMYCLPACACLHHSLPDLQVQSVFFFPMKGSSDFRLASNKLLIEESNKGFSGLPKNSHMDKCIVLFLSS